MDLLADLARELFMVLEMRILPVLVSMKRSRLEDLQPIDMCCLLPLSKP
jgi:hypothetical protein